MSGQNQAPVVNQQYSPQLPSSFQNDEIELRELIKVIWDGKLVIIFTTALFVVGAVVYALNSQEWWSSKAKVTQPQLQDMSAYQQQVKQFQPVFDVYQEDGTVLVSEELDDLVDTEVLFQRFIDAFTSSDNKRRFLNTSTEFQEFKKQLELGDDFEKDSEKVKEASRLLYYSWFKKITARPVNKRSENSPYDISFQSTTKGSSFSLLSNYINVIKEKAHQDALNNLQAIVNGKRNELVQQKRILETQAKNKLLVEAERSRYALDIAEAAEVNTPIQTSDSNEMFGIGLGSKGLVAKVKALESVKNLSIVEPRLQQIDAKLDMLKNLEIDRSIKFQTFRFLENVEQPIARDKPKRSLIVVLGALIGGMLGIVIVFIRFVFRRETV